MHVAGIGGMQKLGTLWLLPHPTECLMVSDYESLYNKNYIDDLRCQSFHSSESSFKGIVDLSQKFFRNSNIYNKAIKIQKLIMEILRLVSMFSRYLCDNSRYIQSSKTKTIPLYFFLKFYLLVKELREAEYITAVMNQIKKDISYQGAIAEFVRVESYLEAKWCLWFLRNRLAITSVAYTVEMGLMPEAYRSLTLNEKFMYQEYELSLMDSIKRGGQLEIGWIQNVSEFLFSLSIFTVLNDILDFS